MQRVRIGGLPTLPPVTIPCPVDWEGMEGYLSARGYDRDRHRIVYMDRDGESISIDGTEGYKIMLGESASAHIDMWVVDKGREGSPGIDGSFTVLKDSGNKDKGMKGIPTDVHRLASSALKFRYTQEEMRVVERIDEGILKEYEEIIARKYERAIGEAEKILREYMQGVLKERQQDYQVRWEGMVGYLRKEIDRLKEKTRESTDHPQISTQTEDKDGGNGQLPVSIIPDQRYVHRDVTCDSCGQYPLQGIRYKSVYKRDYDLCSQCYLLSPDVQDPYISMRAVSPQPFNVLVAMARLLPVPSCDTVNKQIELFYTGDKDNGDKDGKDRDRGCNDAILHSYL